MGKTKPESTPVETPTCDSDSGRKVSTNPMKSITAPQMPTNRKNFALDENSSENKHNG